LADTAPLARQVVTGEDALPGEARIIEAAERVPSALLAAASLAMP
jgi:hypothetical protein